MSWRTLTSPCICWRTPWPWRRPHTPGRDVITQVSLASARTSRTTGAPVHLLASSPQTTSRLLLSPTCSPGPQLAPGHRHWLVVALSPSPWTTTVRQYRCQYMTSPACSVLRFQRADARRDRLDVANSTASSPVTRTHCIAVVIDDLPAPPRPCLAPIKADAPWTISAHQQVLLSLLNLLDLFPSPITHHLTGIWPETAAAVARRRRRSRALPELQRPSFDSSSSTTSIARLADPAGRR
jgi:hypothetical protein